LEYSKAAGRGAFFAEDMSEIVPGGTLVEERDYLGFCFPSLLLSQERLSTLRKTKSPSL